MVDIITINHAIVRFLLLYVYRRHCRNFTVLYFELLEMVGHVDFSYI
jgi:hypothetical protein